MAVDWSYTWHPGWGVRPGTWPRLILPVRSTGLLFPRRTAGGGLFGSRSFAAPARYEQIPQYRAVIKDAPGVISEPLRHIEPGHGPGEFDPTGATRFPDVAFRLCVLRPLVSSSVERQPEHSTSKE